MPVTEFECQIARGQIGRYLGGGPISPEAMKGLEEHLAECLGCKVLVSERRAALLGQLGGEMPTHAVAAVPVKEENPLVAALRKRGEEKKEAPEPAAGPRYMKEEAKGKPVFGKPMALAAALAAVLVGMSYVSRATRGDGALGQKAAATFAAESLPAATAVPKTEIVTPQEPKPAPAKPAVEPVAPKPVAKPTPAPAKPTPVAAKPVAPAVPAASKPAPKRKQAVAKTARPKRSHAPKNRSASTDVRIYGLDGQPLKP